METRILKDDQRFCTHWESEMLWVFSIHHNLSIYSTKYNRSFASIWITDISKDNFKVILSFAQSLLDHMSEHVMKFLFSIGVETPFLKVGPLRISIFSLRSNNSGFGDFFACFVFWKFFCWGEQLLPQNYY